LMTAPLLIYKNSSYLPTKFIIDQFGLKIRWTGKDNIIITNSLDAVNASINGNSNIIIAGSGLILNIFEPCSSETINDMASYADNLLSHNNLKDAMSKYSEILENISSEDMPDMYARVTNNLANTLCKLAEWDNCIDYMDRAIPMYFSALEFYESIKDGDNIHIIKNNLGMLHLKLYELTGNETSKSNALSLFKESLDYYSAQESLENSIVQYNIGTLLNEDSPNESRDCFEKSKKIFINKLDSLNSTEESHLYAMICYNLGKIYGNEGSAESLKKSLNYFDEALKIWTLEKQPLQYANLHMSMGQIYKYLYQLDHSKNSLEKAIENYDESIKIYTFKKYPFKYAQIKYNLGNIYGYLSESGDYPSMIKAKSSFEDCLKFFTKDEYPYYHKKVQSLMNSLT